LHHKGGGEDRERKVVANIGGGGEERTKALEIKGKTHMIKKMKNPNNSKIQTKNLKLSLLMFVFSIVLLLLLLNFSSTKVSTTTL
jgi:hypothetical protein